MAAYAGQRVVGGAPVRLTNGITDQQNWMIVNNGGGEIWIAPSLPGGAQPAWPSLDWPWVKLPPSPAGLTTFTLASFWHGVTGATDIFGVSDNGTGCLVTVAHA